MCNLHSHLFYQFVDRPFTSVEATTAMTEQLTRSIAVPARRCLCGAAWRGEKVPRAKMLSIERRQGRLCDSTSGPVSANFSAQGTDVIK